MSMGNKGGKKNKRYNRYDLTGEYGIGYTNHGVEFYFDLEDYDKIKEYCWVLSKTTDTIVARIPDSDNKLITLHRLVMDAPPKVHVDHIHHNRHDNRKSELSLKKIILTEALASRTLLVLSVLVGMQKTIYGTPILVKTASV